MERVVAKLAHGAMVETPSFSVLTPVYNAEATIARAIESVLCSGQQNIQMILVDDGSIDGSLSVIKEYAEHDSRIIYHEQENAGTAAALNRCMEVASGEYFVRLDADDELLPGYFTTVASMIDQYPDFDIYASNAYRVQLNSSKTLYHKGSRFSHQFSLTVDDILEASRIFGTAAFRGSLAQQIGGFSTSIYNEDYDFWIRMMLAGARHVYTPEALALYRVSVGQKTQDSIRVRESDVEILTHAICSGELSDEQVVRAGDRITSLKKNVALRKRIVALCGEAKANQIFALMASGIRFARLLIHKESL